MIINLIVIGAVNFLCKLRSHARETAQTAQTALTAQAYIDRPAAFGARVIDFGSTLSKPAGRGCSRLLPPKSI